MRTNKKNGIPFQVIAGYLLCVVMFLAGISSLLSHQEKLFNDVEERISRGETMVLDAQTDPSALGKFLYGRRFISDPEEARFVASRIVRERPSGGYENLGALMSYAMRIPADSVKALGIESIARRAAEAEKAGITLPIEQTKVWSGFQADIDGRTPWGDYLIKRDGELVAVISFIDFETHGYHYLRSMHGPAWVAKPTEAEEREVVDAIVDTVKKADKSIAFLRIDTWFADGTEKVLSTVPYDQTVVIDVTGGDDEILARMKRRGRRDVRKSLRECPAEVADETDKALADFSEYYDVMVETGQRDGFTPAPMSDYSDMIGALGADHCRVFAARIEDRVVAWSIVTVNGTHAVRYYAGMRNEVMRLHVTDKLLYSECCILGSQGITEYDLMGIGSDFAPSLKGLNEFKCKFTEEITPVAPARDVPIKKVFYKTLQTVQGVRKALR